MGWRPCLGGFWRDGEPFFRVWAPEAKQVALHLEAVDKPAEQFAMEKESGGFFGLQLKTARPGDLYRFRLEERNPWPDPASRYQPQGVHGPSQLIDPAKFAWSDDAWKGLTREQLVIYELHVGAFTPQGTFQAAARKLPWLRDLGVTAIELLPLADFPGSRNWGYDGVALFAPARCYGTPDDLRHLVNAAHQLKLAVLLDVVYNHFGPDGAYVASYSPPFFSQHNRNPWGASVNLDGEHSPGVRQFFIENARHWIHEYHFDGLRLDATHALIDNGLKPFLAEFTEAMEDSAKEVGRQVSIIAEDERNLGILAKPREKGGWGLDATWADDFHHQVHRCLTGQDDGYFADFSGTPEDIATTIRKGWFYCGQNTLRSGQPRGSDPIGLPASAFVICLQNHDQIGNRAMGERLNHLIDLPAYCAASVLLLMAPEIPLLFMGQEWASSSPFLFFTDHAPELGRIITEGRRAEFESFASFRDPAMRDMIPDPQDPGTFARSRLNWEEAQSEPHAGVRRLYETLLKLRACDPALRGGPQSICDIVALGSAGLLLSRKAATGQVLTIVQLRGPGAHNLESHALCQIPENWAWQRALTTEDPSFAVHPAPIEFSCHPLKVGFTRPGAAVLRATPRSHGDH